MRVDEAEHGYDDASLTTYDATASFWLARGFGVVKEESHRDWRRERTEPGVPCDETWGYDWYASLGAYILTDVVDPLPGMRDLITPAVGLQADTADKVTRLAQ